MSRLQRSGDHVPNGIRLVERGSLTGTVQHIISQPDASFLSWTAHGSPPFASSAHNCTDATMEIAVLPPFASVFFGAQQAMFQAPARAPSVVTLLHFGHATRCQPSLLLLHFSPSWLLRSASAPGRRQIRPSRPVQRLRLATSGCGLTRRRHFCQCKPKHRWCRKLRMQLIYYFQV